eukprot:scaffold120021_cov32-Tisochrysis_lutea.AAC.3
MKLNTAINSHQTSQFSAPMPLRFSRVRDTVIAGDATEDNRYYRSKMEARTMTMTELRNICIMEERLRPLLFSEDPCLALGVFAKGSTPPPYRPNVSLSKHALIEGMLKAGWRP